MAEQNLNKKVFSGMIWKLAERLLANIITFVVSIVLARILIPEDYGIVGIVNIFIAIADVLVTSGLSTSLIQKKNSNQLDFSTIFYCSLLLGAIIYLVMFFSAPLIAEVYNEPSLVPVIRLFALKVPISAVNSVQSAYVSKHMMFKRFFYSTLVGTIVSGIVGIWMALNGFGIWALVVQYLTNSVMNTVILFFTVKWRPTLQFSFKAAKPLISYGWKVMFTDLIGTTFNQLNGFVIGLSYSSADLAYYTRGKNFPELINNNVFTALGSVLFPAMSKVADEEKKIVAMTRRSLKLSSYILFPLLIGMTVVADNLIDVLLTNKWAMSVPFVQLGCLAGIASVVSTITLQTLKGLGRSDVTLRLEFVKKPFFILCLLIATRINVLAIGIVLPIVAFWEAITNTVALSRLVDYKIKEQFKDIRSGLILSVCMGLIVYMVSFINLSSITSLLIQVITGVLVYLGLSIITNQEQFNYLRHFFSKLVKKK